MTLWKFGNLVLKWGEDGGKFTFCAECNSKKDGLPY